MCGNAAFRLEKQVKSCGCSRAHLFLWLYCNLFLIQETFGEKRVFLRRGSAFVPAGHPGKGGMCVWFCKGQSFSFVLLRGFPICWVVQKLLSGFLYCQHAGAELASCNGAEDMHSVL